MESTTFVTTQERGSPASYQVRLSADGPRTDPSSAHLDIILDSVEPADPGGVVARLSCGGEDESDAAFDFAGERAYAGDAIVGHSIFEDAPFSLECMLEFEFPPTPSSTVVTWHADARFVWENKNKLEFALDVDVEQP